MKQFRPFLLAHSTVIAIIFSNYSLNRVACFDISVLIKCFYRFFGNMQIKNLIGIFRIISYIFYCVFDCLWFPRIGLYKGFKTILVEMCQFFSASIIVISIIPPLPRCLQVLPNLLQCSHKMEQHKPTHSQRKPIYQLFSL